MAEFRMPSLGADMDAGTVTTWRVRPGDVVHRGDIVAVVQTDKADIDVEVFEDGTIEELLVPEGVRVPVGTPLARLAGTAPAPEGAPGPPTVAAPPATVPAGQTARPVAPRLPRAPRVWSPLVRHLAETNDLDVARLAGTGPGGSISRTDVERALRATRTRVDGGSRLRASPRARQLAAGLGIDLATVAGTGTAGAITGDDVLRAAEAPPAPPLPAVAPPAATLRETQRRAVGALMARSKREIPHYYLSADVELGAVLDWLQARNETRPPAERVLPAAVLLRAVAGAAVTVEGFNGHWSDEQGFVPAPAVDLGVAVALRQGGLIAPTLAGADRMDLDQLMAALRDLVMRARSGHLTGAEMAGASLTVTNLGDRGVDRVYGVIVPPQVALVGFGRVTPRPWVVDGQAGATVESRPVVTVTLSADHRVTTGHEGSRFLEEIAARLRELEGNP